MRCADLISRPALRTMSVSTYLGVGMATTSGRPVRVTKNGNARTLTIPTEIVAAAGIELGDRYTVEAVNKMPR